MNKLDELLNARDLKFEDLEGEEQDNYFEWLNLLDEKPITIEDVRKCISEQKTKIELELADTDEFEAFFFGVFRRANRKHLVLKAQLKNYLFLELFLESEARKKQMIEASLDKLTKMRMRKKTTPIM